MNGILVFNKPKDISSHDVVYILRKKLKIKQIGHTGTLDPIAQGVLLMCVGKGTKLSNYLMTKRKEYIATFSFGYETETLDSTSKPIKESPHIPDLDKVKESLKKFIGDIEQKPPMYSALKVNGRKLYELAREGKKIDLPARKISIYNIEFLEQISPKTYKIKVDCSSGTYIRSLIRDIGYELGTYATMEGLIRTKNGKYKIEDSISKEEFENMDIEEISKKLIPIDKALYDYKSYKMPDKFYKKVINGVKFRAKLNFENEKILRVYCQDKFIGIGQYIENEEFCGIKIKKMLMGD